MYLSIKTFLQRLNQERKRKISNHNFLVIAALIVGVLGGLAASLLKTVTHSIAHFLQNDLHWQYKYFLYLFFPLVGILLSMLYVKKFIRKSSFETGLTHILYAISKKSSRISFHNIYSQIITSALTVGFGGSTGLEAPIVSSGSAIGSNIGRFFNLNYRETTMLLACGAAAGIAGAFNSPIAGIVFAIEILLPEFSIPAFIPLLISAATASVVARMFYNEQLFFLVTEGWEAKALVFYVILAGLVGVFSIYVTKATYFIKGLFKKVKNPYYRVIIGGLSLGILIFLMPSLYGEGYITIKELLAGHYQSLLDNSIFSQYSSVTFILLIFAVFTLFGKSLATLITLGAGGNGGIFGPSLIMGGLLGFVFAHSINQTGLIHLNTQNFIVAGMAGALSGIMHAPLTGIFLIAEITGGYELMVPLMIVSAISYFINRSTQKYSIYTKGLAEKGELLSHEDKDRTVLNMMKLRYLIDKNNEKLDPNALISDCMPAIIRSHRNIYPAVDQDGKLVGVLFIENIFDKTLDKEGYAGLKVSDMMEEPADIVSINAEMPDVMGKMENDNVWVLPVVDANNLFVGFVSKTTIFGKYRTLLMRNDKYLQ